MAVGPIGIHAICYAPGMANSLDPAFLPFDVTDDPQPDRRETAHMLRFWRAGLHRRFRVSGLLSPRFTKRTQLPAADVISFISEFPDFDVWTLNPYPMYFYLSYNIWEQGEAWHPGLCELASRVFKAADVGIDPRDFPRSTIQSFLFSNYWAGTETFWDRFMPFVARVASAAEQIAGTVEPTNYVGRDVVFWPFLFERLFTTFLILHPEINVRYLPASIDDLTRMAGTNEITALLLRHWVPIIDRWDRIGGYNEEQRSIFRFLQEMHNRSLVNVNLLHWQNATAGAATAPAA
jgi:hypothetical protein